MNINWSLKEFAELTPFELYYILRLRAEVFVVEQECAYQDVDDKDLKGYHLMGLSDDGKLITYCRLLPAGISYDEMSIGRVVCCPTIRGGGLGRELMKEAIERITALFGSKDIRIGAQLYLKKFYEDFGFVAEGEVYIEDGIPHVHMLRKA
jgi:ElaA protein